MDVFANRDNLKRVIGELHSKEIPVSLFIDPKPESIDGAIELNAEVVEIHTGTYANARSERQILTELSKIGSVARLASEQGLVVTAGHGLNYTNVQPILNISEIQEISIGHSIISRAVFTGLHKAVEEMLRIVRSSR